MENGKYIDFDICCECNSDSLSMSYMWLHNLNNYAKLTEYIYIYNEMKSYALVRILT